MVDVLVSEIAAIILNLVQSDDSAHSNVLENLSILVWVMTIPMVSISGLDRSHESNKLARNNPIEITVLDTFIILIFFDVECSEIIPSELDGILETLKAVKKCAIVEAVALRGITEMLEQMMIRTELLVSLLCSHFENDNHEGSHKECTIDHLSTRLI